VPPLVITQDDLAALDAALPAVLATARAAQEATP
jgi:hypothetical protein